MQKEDIRRLFRQGGGVLHLAPNWVPRPFNEPGRRLRLHPDDYFAFGMHRGAITERWFGSVTRAENGPDTGEYEAMSFVWDRDEKKKILFRDCIDELKAEIVGEELYGKYRSWPTYSKFFDNDKPLFHHLHLTDGDAAKIGRNGKPEAYYFPVQYNPYLGRFPLTYFGFDPSATPEQVKDALRGYTVRDTRITEISRAYRIQLGTGWFVPAGVAHAPGSVLTYEPQWNSDVNTIFENVTMGEVNGPELLTGCTPEEDRDNIDAIFAQLNWKESTRPDFKETYFRRPKEIAGRHGGKASEKWIAYANDWIAAKEVSVLPGEEILLADPACYCALVVEGHGSFGGYDCEAPGLVRFETVTADEFFVGETAAKKGIAVKNRSGVEPLVILQNFANNNPETPKTV